MSVSQKQFITAALDPATPAPSGLVDPAGNPAGKRFDVYRNNVAASLSDALEVAFPVVQKLVGDEFFRAMAGVYLRRHQPGTPMLMFYGRHMPAFLETFEPVAHLGYLPDVARLEYLQRVAYHAADADAVHPDLFMEIDPDTLMASRFHLAPAVQLLRSAWPVAAIWHRNMDDTAPDPRDLAEDVLVTRPDYNPVITALPPGGGAFMQSLMEGEPLETALQAGTIASGEFEFSAILGILLNGSAITDITQGTPDE
jgi:hypothetical protein